MPSIFIVIEVLIKQQTSFQELNGTKEKIYTLMRAMKFAILFLV